MPHRRMHRLALSLLLVLIVGGGLAGCGKKGPLYLPDGHSAGDSRPVSDH